MTVKNVSIIILLLAMFSCGGPLVPETPVVVFGVDALEWEVLLPLVQEGKMPVFEGLMRQGAFGTLETFKPTLSPAIWTSVATGKTKEKHGIPRFRKFDPDNPNKQELYTNTDRKTKAIWNILNDYDKSTHVIGWFMTYPVEPVRGVMVAQTNTVGAVQAGQSKGALLKGVEGQVYPPEIQPEMLEIHAQCLQQLPQHVSSIFGEFNRIGQQGPMLFDDSLWSIGADYTYVTIAERLAEKPFDFMAVYLGAPDIIGHRFWRYLEPDAFENKPTQEEIAAYQDVLTDYYQYVDRALGEILEKVSPEPIVFVVSDHGMKPYNTDDPFETPDQEHIENLLSGHHKEAPDGVLIVSGPGIPKQPFTADTKASDLERLASVFDITPTILALEGIPIGRDMDGKPLWFLLMGRSSGKISNEYVDTHDTREWLDSRPTAKQNRKEIDERIKQLKNVGYL